MNHLAIAERKMHWKEQDQWAGKVTPLEFIALIGAGWTHPWPGFVERALDAARQDKQKGNCRPRMAYLRPPEGHPLCDVLGEALVVAGSLWATEAQWNPILGVARCGFDVEQEWARWAFCGGDGVS